MATPSDIIKRGTRAAQPTPSANAAGVLYYVTDEKLLERWSGSAWESVEGFSGGDGTIAALTNKANPTDADYLLIEDAAASNAQKHITIANLFEGGNPDFFRVEEQASDPSTPASGYGAFYGKTDGAPYYINDAGLAFDMSTDYVRVYSSSAQTLSNTTTATLTFNSERVDTNGMHDNVTNNTRLTATRAGFYIIGTTVRFQNSGTGTRLVAIRLDGTTLIDALWLIATSASINTDLTVVTGYYLSAGQYVEVRAYQDSGGNLDVLSTGNYSPEFWMAKVG